MYIESVPNRNSKPTILLRECWREGGKVRKRTLANLTRWPAHVVEAVRRSLSGERMVLLGEVFSIERSLPHGHVEAVLKMIKRLGLDELIASKRCRARDLVVAMIVERLIHPCSKLATTRLWKSTTLAGELGVAEAEVDELYAALGWLQRRQKNIETKLATRHLAHDELVLYDVSSSYYEGRTCPLARYGYSRDRRSDLPQIVYGVMTDGKGCPISIDVYAGNTADPATVPEQVEKLRGRFGLSQVVLVGDRGMLTQTKIEALKDHPGLGWITALRSGAIRKLVGAGAIQMSLFDERNLAEISSPEFPGERLVACYNPFLAEERRRKRGELLAATDRELEKLALQAARPARRAMRKEDIAVRYGKIIGRRKMEKHYIKTIEDGKLEWARNEESIRLEEMLDGIYVVRTSEPAEKLSPENVARSYKSLSLVERAFRTLKGVELRVRPIYHRLEETVRAHFCLCLLAYYVEWHMRRALRPVLFDDEELEINRTLRDPVAPAKASGSAKRKKLTRRTVDGFDVHSFETLMIEMATRSKNFYRPKSGSAIEPVEMIADPTPFQTRVFELLNAYPVSGN